MRLGLTVRLSGFIRGSLGAIPDQGDLATALLILQFLTGDTDAALNYLSRIQPGDPAYVQSLVSAADVYRTLGLYEVSEQNSLEAKRLAPDEPVVTFRFRRILF